jgi:hypothetical protein
MELPGGLWENDRRQREYAFRPLSGEVELAVADPPPAGGLPAQVTAALAASLETLGGEGPTLRRVADLCVDDRRFLMYRLAVEVGLEALWRSSQCPACGARFDLCVEPARVPVKPAADSFPFGEWLSEDGPRAVRVPTGADQDAIDGLPADEARRALLARCVLDGEPVREDEHAAVEAALEAVSPEVARTVSAACPDCDEVVEVPLDPYACLGSGLDRLLNDVDMLASAYHWAEDAILALPTARRRRYLRRAAGSAA